MSFGGIVCMWRQIRVVERNGANGGDRAPRFKLLSSEIRKENLEEVLSIVGSNRES